MSRSREKAPAESCPTVPRHWRMPKAAEAMIRFAEFCGAAKTPPRETAELAVLAGLIAKLKRRERANAGPNADPRRARRLAKAIAPLERDLRERASRLGYEHVDWSETSLILVNSAGDRIALPGADGD